ncbi:4a-hydroxytetrahydrobiopterin dehydratase [Acetobacter oeni]|uniref:Putative pterin-4-alpha-carbinolamine dehydratase n=1 Tax=Acetobacter oeni TaxID=304077 RepID=A0A511XLL5_9PROT|nr:4a-hydroxytetrahydrobiopterin dehydratase [Acetobacter oeni]MBB3883623.1 4a-hydroxytetrahydrobiopterin dehydratase [Acetobacter oeni]NHO19642.1 pterin-4-alpha-carbinolamine dehydratase [Acetobacter oeni]GBR02688.1 pterin-4a-carbinolamine dehydratase [Acetobacter oeni LMG 21952]GEN63828.1 pterin-4-alpha-carbinolamine dehydratase [Acetobacter oeni]
MSDLTKKKCAPCSEGATPLSRNEAEAWLARTQDWSLQDNATRIERHFRFPDFAAALAFVNQVGALAEEEDHHPDISFGWGYATVSFSTHKIKGLHENDFIMAAKVSRLTRE